jgi:glycerophosphoryl diester phosphodiesterase
MSRHIRESLGPDRIGAMPNRPLLLGHRGARATRTIPENSIASFQLTLDHGCDGFEFDVRRAADGTAVICHNPVWHGHGAGKRGVEIAGATVSELIEIPTLDEVMATFASRAYLDIELKVTGLEEQVLAALAAHRPALGYVVSSFIPETLETLHKLAPDVPLGLICDSKAQLSEWEHLPLAAVIPQYKLVTRELVNAVHLAGKRMLVWTVDDEKTLKQLAEWGVDGLISDETERLPKLFPGQR